MSKKPVPNQGRKKYAQKGNPDALHIIPLGGLGEIGKNMTAFEYGDDIIIVDIGSIFPREDMPGVDLVIPDTTYLQMNRDRIRGYMITHGHEDHIGAAPYVLREIPAPVYATRLTCALIESKLKEHKLLGSVNVNIIEPGDIVEAGVFKVEFIRMSHSIAGTCALAIHTPVGIVVHTGDFKVDYTPVDGQLMDFNRLAALGTEGVLLMMADSTNVERPGYTMSERKVGETFNNVFDRAQGRIIIAMFASNVHRIQMVIDAAVQHRRRVCLIGRSMINVAKLSMQLGYMNVPEGYLINADDMDRYPDEQIVVITTGSQGEPMSGLSRMAFQEHRKLEIHPGDMVIVSATPIPGNEKSVSRVLNQLVKTGADVIYDALAEVHVSGHARQEELKLLQALIKPKFFIPVHGEYRHLYHHAKLAVKMGVPEENV
ncbi:MAG: ribonuclease J, partial [Clostridia bacterium]|nr:ribonuclease J [Clostridia bacterium]